MRYLFFTVSLMAALSFLSLFIAGVIALIIHPPFTLNAVLNLAIIFMLHGLFVVIAGDQYRKMRVD